MMWYLAEFFFGWPGDANIHLAKTLAAIGGNDLGLKMFGHFYGYSRLPNSRRPSDNNNCFVGRLFQEKQICQLPFERWD